MVCHSLCLTAALALAWWGTKEAATKPQQAATAAAAVRQMVKVTTDQPNEFRGVRVAWANAFCFDNGPLVWGLAVSGFSVNVCACASVYVPVCV